MPRLGLLTNPDAGLGGRLGVKGSDGQAEYARSQGAEDRSGPRMRAMIDVELGFIVMMASWTKGFMPLFPYFHDFPNW